MSNLSADFVTTLRLARRLGYVSSGFWLLLALIVVALLAAGFSARQPSTVMLDVGISFIRIGVPLLSILMIQDIIGREFERRYCLTSITYPRSRHWWLLGRYCGVFLMVSVMLVVMAVALVLTLKLSGITFQQATPAGLGIPYFTTLFFVLVDLLVVTTFATLLAVWAKTPNFVLIGAIGFTLVARSYSAVIELLRLDGNLVAKLADPEKYRGSLSALNYLLPDLGSLDVRMVALYGQMAFLPTDWWLRVVSALGYSLAMLAFAALTLKRRDFG